MMLAVQWQIQLRFCGQAMLLVTLHKHTRAIHIPNFDKLRGAKTFQLVKLTN